MGSEDKAEKTIKASPRKRRKAKQEGNLPRSREVSNIATFAIAIFAFFFFGGLGVTALGRLMRDFLIRAGTTQPTPETVNNLLWEAAFRVSTILGPLFAALLVTAIAFSMLFQGGWNVSFQAFRFKPGKFNPVTGLKRLMLSSTTLVKLLRTILVVLIVAWMAWDTLAYEIDRLPGLMMAPLPQVINYTANFIFTALFKILLLFIILALLDLAWTRYRHEEKLKMTPWEHREDMKMTEGDPKIKKRIRTLQMQQYRRRMMAEVPRADVVITNPTHFAVALRYEAERRNAPEVIAKGRGHLAEKIKEIAKENGISLVTNPALAQALYRSCEVGDLVPPDLFRAVAEVLAYVYKLKSRIPA